MVEVMTYISGRHNEDCHLILYGSTRELFYEVPQGVTLHLPDFEFNYKHRQWMTLKTIRYIRKTIKNLQPDVVLSFGEFWNNMVLLSMIGVNIPIYISDRSSPRKDLGFLHNNLRRLLYPSAAGIIAQTQKSKELFNKNINHKNIRVIGNPIREIKVSEKREQEKVILSIGRLIRTKHFDRLIDIFYHLNQPEWKLIIIGGDPNIEKISTELQEKVNKLELHDRVILTGQLKNTDDYLMKASIFALTSSSEGFPNVIGEAMWAGLPVVAYDCIAGPSEMIEDGKNGFLIPQFDDDLFAKRLLYLMKNTEKRMQMGQYARESIRKFSSDTICEQFYSFVTKPV